MEGRGVGTLNYWSPFFSPCCVHSFCYEILQPLPLDSATCVAVHSRMMFTDWMQVEGLSVLVASESPPCLSTMATGRAQSEPPHTELPRPSPASPVA